MDPFPTDRRTQLKDMSQRQLHNELAKVNREGAACLEDPKMAKKSCYVECVQRAVLLSKMIRNLYYRCEQLDAEIKWLEIQRGNDEVCIRYSSALLLARMIDCREELAYWRGCAS